ncbi:MAG: acyl-ACP--UDP-N-acetylglucosamine O-acyltransferase [Oligoflexales bacterium]|nr:acyl-ACP--UDP-N-acetylglucosamine O-acyltransferase [Oligoflexales bacterium]
MLIKSYANAIRQDLGKFSIHPMAQVHPKAKVGNNVNLAPLCSIGPDVEIADDVWIGQGAIVQGKVKIGQGSIIGNYATIGAYPQDLKYNGEKGAVEIGKNNVIREYVNISQGTEGGGMITKVGDHNLIMVYSHLGHDCLVGNDCILANGVSLGGHVTIDDGAIIGGHSGVHQFCHVGSLAMLGGGTILVNDAAPYCTIQGNHAELAGLNLVGLKRSGLDAPIIEDIKKIFKLFFRSNIGVEAAIEKTLVEVPASTHRDYFIKFSKASTRGLCR